MKQKIETEKKNNAASTDHVISAIQEIKTFSKTCDRKIDRSRETKGKREKRKEKREKRKD